MNDTALAKAVWYRLDRNGCVITVLIPTHNRLDLLKRTLSSLAEAEQPESLLEVVVVENGLRNGAEDVVRALPGRWNARYLYHARGNKSEALNLALKGIGRGLIVFLDDDVRLAPGLLTAYETAVKRHGVKAFFGGPLGIDYAVEPPEWLILPPSARGWSLPEGTLAVERPDFIGPNWAAFADDLRRAGGFNPDVGPGGMSGARGDEADMQGRLLGMGLRGIYVPDALVWHFVPRERSSKKWSLERSYENAITSGLAYSDDVPRVLGYPRWAFGAIARKWLTAVSAVSTSEQQRYMAWRDFYLARGFAKGARFAHRKKLVRRAERV